MQELIKGSLPPVGGGRQTMGSLVCLQAQDEFTTAASEAQNRLHTSAPRWAHGPLAEGDLHVTVRRPGSPQCAEAQEAVWLGESPQDTQTQPPTPGESLSTFEALS